MYPLNQTANSTIASAPIPYPLDSPGQQSAGIASSLQSLSQQVESAVKLAYSVRAALGIAAPETKGKEPSQPASLLDVLNSFRCLLERANQDFETVINYINS
jgi:hypothetical protein